MSVQRDFATDSPETAIRLHLCSVGEISARETSLNLLRRCNRIWLLATGNKVFINLNAKALQVPFELSTNAQRSQHGLVIKMIFSTPLRVLLSLCDKGLVNVQVGQVVPFLNGELSSSRLCRLLLPIMIKPNRSLKAGHGR